MSDMDTKQVELDYKITKENQTNFEILQNEARMNREDTKAEIETLEVSIATKLAIADIDDLPADDADVPVSSQYMYRKEMSRFRGALVNTGVPGQVIATGTITDVQLDDVSTLGYDPLGKWDNTSYYWEVPYTGTYAIHVNGTLENLGSGNKFYVMIRVDDGGGKTERMTGSDYNEAGAARYITDSVGGDLALTAGDKVYFSVLHNEGANLTLNEDSKGNTTYMSIHCVAITA